MKFKIIFIIIIIYKMPFSKDYDEALADIKFIDKITIKFTEDEKNVLCDIESRHSIKLVHLYIAYKNNNESFMKIINIFKKEFKNTNFEKESVFDHYICKNTDVYDTDDTNS